MITIFAIFFIFLFLQQSFNIFLKKNTKDKYTLALLFLAVFCPSLSNFTTEYANDRIKSVYSVGDQFIYLGDESIKVGKFHDKFICFSW